MKEREGRISIYMDNKCSRCGGTTQIMAIRDGKAYCAACDTYLETCKLLGIKTTKKLKKHMDTAIKIDLVPKQQTNSSRDSIRITCGDIVAWGYSLREAISEFDRELLRDK